MFAYVLVDTKIKDQDAYDKYKALARPLAESYGGRYLTRGGAMDVIQDELWTPTRMVLIEFPSMENARAFMESDEYQPVKIIREANADCTLLILEGR